MPTVKLLPLSTRSDTHHPPLHQSPCCSPARPTPRRLLQSSGQHQQHFWVWRQAGPLTGHPNAAKRPQTNTVAVGACRQRAQHAPLLPYHRCGQCMCRQPRPIEGNVEGFCLRLRMRPGACGECSATYCIPPHKLQDHRGSSQLESAQAHGTHRPRRRQHVMR